MLLDDPARERAGKTNEVPTSFEIIVDMGNFTVVAGSLLGMRR
jgi:hypothetical protein